MDQSRIQIVITITFFIVLSLLAGIFFYIFQYRKRKILHLSEKIIITEQHHKELLSTQLEMQTQTMQHIGREIHDNVGQKLTLASLYTQQLAYENKAPQITDKIEIISTIINESLAELRQLSKSLTDDSINEHEITELLQQECDKVNELKQSAIIFSSNRSDLMLPYETKSIIIRIVQEFLQNSIKHANCKNISVALNAEKKYLQLYLQDDGKGFDSSLNNSKGIGLLNMKKRTELIGGTYSIESTLNSGTRLTITIPL